MGLLGHTGDEWKHFLRYLYHGRTIVTTGHNHYGRALVYCIVQELSPTLIAIWKQGFSNSPVLTTYPKASAKYAYRSPVPL